MKKKNLSLSRLITTPLISHTLHFVINEQIHSVYFMSCMSCLYISTYMYIPLTIIIIINTLKMIKVFWNKINKIFFSLVRKDTLVNNSLYFGNDSCFTKHNRITFKIFFLKQSPKSKIITVKVNTVMRCE